MADVGMEMYLRNSAVVSRVIAGETLVVPIRGDAGDLDSIFSFNALASDLWNLLEKEFSVDEMTSWVLDRFEVSQEQAVMDIREFVGELPVAGLVTCVTQPQVSTKQLEMVRASRGI
jgi:hypothetical protein